MAPQLGDGFAEGGDGVVVGDHAAVPGATGDRQSHPPDALLGRLDGVEAQIVADLVGEAPDLADRLGASLEQLRVVVDQPARAVQAARLLVGQEGEHDVARGFAAAAQAFADDREGHGVHVLHVDGAAAPDVAVVGDLAREGVHRPVGGISGNDVEVTVDQ